MNAAAAPVPPADREAFRREFVDFAIGAGALRFGEFTTKAGRRSPYFFNSGLFSDGARLGGLAGYYARAALASGIGFDLLFGPAYKGITLAAATAVALAGLGHNVPYCFNRKEAKDHGEGGRIVGRALTGRVLIVDDVITAGTAIRESIDLIRAAGATPAGVLLALDREERGRDSARSAVQEVRDSFGLPVVSILTLGDLIAGVEAGVDGVPGAALADLRAYRAEYGAR